MEGEARGEQRVEPGESSAGRAPGHVDEKRQEGEERCRKADDGDDAHGVADEGQLLLAEEHRGARGRAVLLAHEGVAQVWVHLELPRAPEAKVSLHGRGRLVAGVGAPEQVLGTGVGLIAVWEPGSNKSLLSESRRPE